MGLDLVDITAKRAALSPHRIAFADGVSGRTLTYSALENRCARLAGVLAAQDIGSEDRVAILCRNRIEFFEALFACAKLGAVLVPLNWRMPAAELAPLMADCTPKLLLFGREDEACARELAHEGVALIGFDESYEALIAETPPLATPRHWRGDAIWTLLYTSGTTGQPKGVIQTVQMTLVNYVNASQAFGLRENDRTLNFLPLFHAAGIQLLTLPTLIAGGTVTMLPAFEPARILKLLQTTDIFFGVPTAYQQLALEPGFDKADFAHVRAWGCGGAPLPDVLVELYAAKGARVQNGYGMTETGPTAFVAAPEDSVRKIGSVGKPQILLDARIVGAKGKDVDEGEAGEVWMRGPGVTPGYWRRPDETAKAFSPDGWLKSGDLGKRDSEGCYYVVGRIKEMFISGGENVYPAEIENLLARHPAVLEAAVIGVADEKWGEVGHAFVQLRPGALAPSGTEFAQFCRAGLAGYKIPKGFSIVEEFPRTAAGKIRKHLLAAPSPLTR
jgi:fatty-acyl-CoA synthase